METTLPCAICGKALKTIEVNHLKTHNLTPAEYKAMGHQTHSEKSRALISNSLKGNRRNPLIGKYGPEHPRYKGGHVMQNGYRVVHDQGRWIYEHRLVMERQLGRSLTLDEHIHHINHDKLDNRPENLMLVTNKQHGHIHPHPERWADYVPLRKKARLLRSQGLLLREIRDIIGVHYETIRRWCS